MERGHYIALEGIEGAGKSTLTGRVAAWLRDRGHQVIVVREPGGTEAGEAIRELLLHRGHLEPWTEALLFAAQRAQLVREVIEPALARGTWVLSDRTVYSSLAYQGGGRRLGVAEVRQVNTPGLRGVWPELVIVLRLDPETGLRRQNEEDRIGAEGIDFQARVASVYEDLASEQPDVFRIVAAHRPLGEVEQDVRSILEARW